MTTAAIVQARVGSTRLWGKTLRALPTGRLVVQEVLHRAKMVPGVDVVVCAIPDTLEDDTLVPVVGKIVDVWLTRGSELDVLGRYSKAAYEVKADIVLRLTADCPLLDPSVCGDLLKLRERYDAGYASTSWPARSFAHGEDCEAITRDVLDRANREATLPADREHAGCPWIHRQPDIKQVLLKSIQDRSGLRWTLDTAEDLLVIRRVLEKQGTKST